uniref:GPN-loop GTPase n=1 Tax=Tetradesmus obliquus TaxID=3088 RepID=A0A383VW06_TETOB|eukprot:jgi/Sobl393_1/6347/SZX78420.1
MDAAAPMEAEQRTAGQASTSSSTAAGPSAKPIVVLVIGMAGSGKTTLIQRVNSHMHQQKLNGYIINLDPAVSHLPYGANIDIRDTVNYKNVMKQYGLGPNGGILTACNLFATRFDQVIQLVEKPRDPPLQYVFADTPGQIEIFTWSASGQLVTDLFASSMPTVVMYVIDTPRCTAPQTFMSNMLQAVSILYKTKLPMLLAFNKVDVSRHEFALEWMADFEAYSAALEADASYAATLSRSLSLVLEEFYDGMRCVGLSALTGEGMDELFKALGECVQEYQQFYVPELQAKQQRKEALEQKRREKEMAKLRADMAGKASLQEGGNAAGAAAAGVAGAAGRAAAGVQQEQLQQGLQEDEDAEESVDLNLSDDSIGSDTYEQEQ